MISNYKKSETSLLPEDWKSGRLADIALKFLNGGTPSTKIKEYWNGDIPWITGTDVMATFLNPKRRFISRKGLENSSTNLVPKGGLLVVTRTGVGNIALAECDTAISQDLTGVLLNEDMAHNIFYLWYLIKYSPKYVSLAQGTTIGGILRKDVERTPVPIPPLNEQIKIAEILTTFDDAIEKTDAIIKETQQLKHGLMQKLFTEGIGHTRFKKTKIGRIPEEWQTAKLKEVSIFNNGANFSKHEVSNKGILMADVLNMYSEDVLVDATNFYRINKKLNKNFILEKGDILFVRSSLKREGVGLSALFDGHHEPVSFCGFLIKARLINSNISPKFLAYYLRAPQTRSKIISLSGTVAITNINQESLGLLEIPIPQMREQIKITNIFSELNDKIENEQFYKSELEQLKKGLSQVLLTGKVRVKV